MIFREGDQVIQALPSDGPDGSLTDRIGLRAPIRRLDYTQAHVLSRNVEFLREDPTPVVDEKPVDMVTRNGLTKLLLGPLGCRVSSGVAMQYPPRPMFQHHEHIEDPKRGCHGNKEITRQNRPRVVLQEGAPPLVPARAVRRRLRHVFPNCPRRDLDAELEEEFVGDPLLPHRGFSRAICRMRALTSA